jgi:ketosteroid isomerase-like protein
MATFEERSDTACAVHERKSEDGMSTEENKATVRRMIEAYPKAALGDEAVLKQFFREDVVTHTPHHHHHTERGLQGLKGEALELGRAAPQLEMKPDMLIAEGDLVMAHFSARIPHHGRAEHRHAGEIQPSGKELSMSAVIVCRVKDGKIAEYWRYDNMLDGLAEAGVISISQAGARG